jgi:hypothetical protein
MAWHFAGVIVQVYAILSMFMQPLVIAPVRLAAWLLDGRFRRLGDRLGRLASRV